MVADMVPVCDTVADIGCDHAYLSVWLLRECKARYAYACDVRPGPLEKASETIRFFHMEERAETILCDGLEGLVPGDADVIVMAGMGGELMTRILTDGAGVAARSKCLLLQAQSDRESVRRKVEELGFVITDERCVVEDGKFYLCMSAVPASDVSAEAREPYEPWEYRYGRWLVKRKDMTYLSWLTEECEKKIAMLNGLLAADTALANERLASAAAECEEIASVMKRMY